MKKSFNVSGMSCGHCRLSVEKALNSIPGVRATVTLDPPVATIEYTGPEKPLHELRKALSEAGEYGLEERTTSAQ